MRIWELIHCRKRSKNSQRFLFVQRCESFHSLDDVCIYIYLYTHIHIYISSFSIFPDSSATRMEALSRKRLKFSTHEVKVSQSIRAQSRSCAAAQSEGGCVALSVQTPAMFGFSASAACDYFFLAVGIYFVFPMGTSGQDVGADSTIPIHFQGPGRWIFFIPVPEQL